jgi:2-polyprenyl-6-methoxyphenol hydroxylase-like FAD-dependent oxidoreductase
MLARLLHMHNIRCVIFEGEASVNYRSQGGTLDLRTDTGLAAIKKAGLQDEFEKYARYDGESLWVTDKKLTTWMRRSQGKSDRKRAVAEAPEIDRSDLRKILMESVPEDSVRWGMKLSRVEETEGGLALHFANGVVERGFDLIVGCDGAFSKTRSLLTAEKPSYCGLAGWVMQIPNAERTAPEIYKMVNRGSVFAYSDGKNLTIQQLSSGAIQVSTYGPYKEDYISTCGFDTKDLKIVKDVLRQQMHDWAPELLSAIDKASEDLAWRNLYMLPVGFTWRHGKGVTLLGDAAHLMTPFAGIGVNTAFYDAMVLSQEILEYTKSNNPDSLDAHITSYEDKMFKHAHEGQKLTFGSMNDMFFTPGAPRTSIESWILRHGTADMPTWLHPFFAFIVYVGFWIYKWFV